MDFRKNFGIVLVMLGMILTLNQTQEFSGLVETLLFYIKNYWPVCIVILGIYLLTVPTQRKK